MWRSFMPWVDGDGDGDGEHDGNKYSSIFAMITNIYLHGSGTALRTLSSHLESRCDKENSLCLHEAPCLAAETGPI